MRQKLASNPEIVASMKLQADAVASEKPPPVPLPLPLSPQPGPQSLQSPEQVVASLSLSPQLPSPPSSQRPSSPLREPSPPVSPGTVQPQTPSGQIPLLGLRVAGQYLRTLRARREVRRRGEDRF